MCDYSLELYQSVPAKQGETLIAHKFPSGTVGLAASKEKAEAGCVTCVTPGTLLAIDYPDGRCDTAIFTRLELPQKAGEPYFNYTHRDGLILSSGTNHNLQTLAIGTQVTVLMLAVADAPEDRVLASPAPLPAIEIAADVSDPVGAIIGLIG